MNDHRPDPVPRDLPDQQSGSTPQPDLWQQEPDHHPEAEAEPPEAAPTPYEPTD